MAQFEELQQLWQQQPPRAVPLRDAAALQRRLPPLRPAA